MIYPIRTPYVIDKLIKVYIGAPQYTYNKLLVRHFIKSLMCTVIEGGWVVLLIVLNEVFPKIS